jgi:poly(3-hydroxybutyrate) depolymerase
MFTRTHPARPACAAVVCAALALMPRAAMAACPAEPVLETSGDFAGINLAVPGFENHSIYGSKSAFLYVPTSYRAGTPMPLFVLLHGTAGSRALAVGNASTFRNFWAGAAEAGGFIVAAPAASGSVGGWVAPVSPTDTPSDYDVIEALIERVERDYDIDPARRYLWGFSGGGHVAIDVLLNRFHRRVNGDRFAAFAVSAGVSAGLACSGLSAELCGSVFAAGGSHRPIDVRIGLSDPLLPRAVEDRPRFLAHGWSEGLTFFWQPFAGAHTVLPEHPLQIWNNLCRFRNGDGKTPGGTALPPHHRADSRPTPTPPMRPAGDTGTPLPGLRGRARKR